jgi:hypothetical protein
MDVSTMVFHKNIDRRSFLGGSDARIIMGDDEQALLRLWHEKRGEAEPEDLSDNLIVQLGTATEDLNRRWYERNTGQMIKHVQHRIQHPVHKWMAATLDGLVDPGDAVFEAKFMLPWTFSEEAAAEKHMAQLQHTICGWRTQSPQCCRSLLVAESGSSLPFMLIRYTNICCSPRRRSFGVAFGMEKYRACLASNLLAPDSKRSVLWI